MKIGWKQVSTLGVVLLGLLLASCGYQAASVPQVIRDYESVTGCRLKVAQGRPDGDVTTLASVCKNDALVMIWIPDDGDAHDRLLAGTQPMKEPYGDLLFYEPSIEMKLLFINANLLPPPLRHESRSRHHYCLGIFYLPPLQPGIRCRRCRHGKPPQAVCSGNATCAQVDHSIRCVRI